MKNINDFDLFGKSEQPEIINKNNIKVPYKKAIEIFFKLYEFNEDIALTGSLMLAHLGVIKKDYFEDIDIISSKESIDFIIPKGFHIYDDWNEYECESLIYKPDKLIIDVLLNEDEDFQFYKGIPCGTINGLINAKFYYINNDKTNTAKGKHLRHLGNLMDYMTPGQLNNYNLLKQNA